MLPHRPCLAQVLHLSIIHPRHSVSTTAAPSELGHLTILSDHSEPKSQCPAEQSSPRHLQGKPPSFRSCQRTECVSANSSWERGMWMCSRSRAVSTRYFERQVPHTDCSLGQHRKWRHSSSLLCTLFFGCWGAQSQLERGNELGTGSGRPEKTDASPGTAMLQS